MFSLSNITVLLTGDSNYQESSNDPFQEPNLSSLAEAVDSIDVVYPPLSRYENIKEADAEIETLRSQVLAVIEATDLYMNMHLQDLAGQIEVIHVMLLSLMKVVEQFVRAISEAVQRYEAEPQHLPIEDSDSEDPESHHKTSDELVLYRSLYQLRKRGKRVPYERVRGKLIASLK